MHFLSPFLFVIAILPSLQILMVQSWQEEDQSSIATMIGNRLQSRQKSGSTARNPELRNYSIKQLGDFSKPFTLKHKFKKQTFAITQKHELYFKSLIFSLMICPFSSTLSLILKILSYKKLLMLPFQGVESYQFLLSKKISQ